MLSETAFKNIVMKRLRELEGIWFFKSQEVAVRGIPDIIGCFKGRFFAIELKRDYAERSDSQALQEYNLDKIRECKGLGFMWSPNNWEKYFDSFFLGKHVEKAKEFKKNDTLIAKRNTRIYTKKALYD